jgi:hypothetical protein
MSPCCWILLYYLQLYQRWILLVEAMKNNLSLVNFFAVLKHMCVNVNKHMLTNYLLIFNFLFESDIALSVLGYILERTKVLRNSNSYYLMPLQDLF